MAYQITDDFSTADVGLTVTGESAEQIFIEAAYGLMAIVSERDNINKIKSIKIIIEEENLEDLLYHWLSDIIYHKDTDYFLINDISLEIEINNIYKLTAELYGDTIDPERHILKADVKALTYYKFKIEKRETGWFSEMVFDL